MMRYLKLPCTMLNFADKDSSCPLNQGNLLAIGSTLTFASTYSARIPELSVFGSGFLTAPPEDEIWMSGNIRVYALRGKLSRERLEFLLGKNLQHVPLGDPGLLIRRIFPHIKRTHRFRVGIILHWKDGMTEALQSQLRFETTTWKFISITEKPEDFVSQVAECDLILSTALHGLICADSLGIPNRRLRVADIHDTSDYKYLDYYSAFSDVPLKTLDLRDTAIHDEDISRLIDEYSISQDEVDAIADRLEQAFHQLTKSPTASPAAAPTVSIILPISRSCHQLADILNTLREQSFGNWECLCLTAGTDNDRDETLKACASQDSRFRIIPCRTNDADRVRARGIQEARGEFLLFIAPDTALSNRTVQDYVASTRRRQMAFTSRIRKLTECQGDEEDQSAWLATLRGEVSILHQEHARLQRKWEAEARLMAETAQASAADLRAAKEQIQKMKVPDKRSCHVKLFGFLPFIKVLIRPNATRVTLFSFLPLLKIKHLERGNTYLLFHFLPLARTRKKSV